MAPGSNPIDREKLRPAVPKRGDDYVRHMLDDAIALPPSARLHKIAKKYLDLKRLRPDAEKATTASLLTRNRTPSCAASKSSARPPRI